MDASANSEELTVEIDNTQTTSTEKPNPKILFDRDSRETVGEPSSTMPA
jgi:hypothetical protein